MKSPLYIPEMIRLIASYTDLYSILQLKTVCKKFLISLTEEKETYILTLKENSKLEKIKWRFEFSFLKGSIILPSGELFFDPRTNYEEALKNKDINTIKYLEEVITGLEISSQAKFNYMRTNLTHITKDKLDTIFTCYSPYMAKGKISLYYHGRFLGDYGDYNLLSDLLPDFNPDEQDELKKGFFQGFLIAGHTMIQEVKALLLDYPISDEPCYTSQKYQKYLPYSSSSNKACFLSNFLTDEEFEDLYPIEMLIRDKKWNIIAKRGKEYIRRIIRKLQCIPPFTVYYDMIEKAPDHIDLSDTTISFHHPDRFVNKILFNTLLNASPDKWKRAKFPRSIIISAIKTLIFHGNYKQVVLILEHTDAIDLEELKENPVINYLICI